MQSPSGHTMHPYSPKGVAIVLTLTAFVLGCLPTLAAAQAAQSDRISFDMVVSAGAASCLPDATAHVTIRPVGVNDRMQIQVKGLPPKKDFTLFVLQAPTAPFGMAWYQGDIHTGTNGTGTHQFFGIFDSETHVLAPGSIAAPQTDPGIDALTNPATAPVHMYHLGVWFADPADAAAAGCPATVTPFDGDHAAGIQVLNTSNFPALEGPLGQVQ
jgi:hypothetical protein